MLRLVRQHAEHDQLYQEDASGSHRLSASALEILLDTCLQNMPAGAPHLPGRQQGVGRIDDYTLPRLHPEHHACHSASPAGSASVCMTLHAGACAGVPSACMAWHHGMAS